MPTAARFFFLHNANANAMRPLSRAFVSWGRLSLSLFFPARLRSFKYRQAQPWSLLTPSPPKPALHLCGQNGKKIGIAVVTCHSFFPLTHSLFSSSYLVLSFFLSCLSFLLPPIPLFIFFDISGPFDPCSLVFGLRSAHRFREFKKRARRKGGVKGKDERKAKEKRRIAVATA